MFIVKYLYYINIILCTKLISNVLQIDVEIEAELPLLVNFDNEQSKSILIRHGKEAIKSEDINKSLLLFF